MQSMVSQIHKHSERSISLYKKLCLVHNKLEDFSSYKEMSLEYSDLLAKIAKISEEKAALQHDYSNVQSEIQVYNY